MRLAEFLDLPLRERNALLLAAGFAPAFQERSLEDLATARRAVDQIVQAHKPYPAFAIDRHWNVVLSNNAIPRLYDGVSLDLLRPPINAIRLMLHPLGLAPRIVNLPLWRAHTIAGLRRQVEATADPGIQALLAEVAAYPFAPDNAAAEQEDSAERYATPLRIATEFGVVSFLNTVTVFGTPTDVTLSELALEMLFPADPATAVIVAALDAAPAAWVQQIDALAETG